MLINDNNCVQDKWLTFFVRRVGVSLLFGLLLGSLVVFLNDTESSSQMRRGDFPGFFAPAVIVARGMSDLLYDLNTQCLVQNEFWPSFKGEFYIYAYPPFVAWLLQPLAFFDAITAKIIATLLMFGAVLLALYIVRPLVPILRQHTAFGLSLSLLFPPLAGGIFATQNTGLSLLLYVCSFMSLRICNKVGDIIAGVFMGIWLFKPQYAGLMIIASLAIGRPFVLLGVCIPASIYYGIGVHMHGFLWPLLWLKSAGHFTELNTQTNLRQLVSIWGAGQALAMAFSLEGDTWKWFARIISFGVFGVALCVLRRITRKNNGIDVGFLWFAPIICVVSPQTLFYDLGICMPTLLWTIGKLTRRVLMYVGVAYVLISIITLLRTHVDYPLFFIVSTALVWVSSVVTMKSISSQGSFAHRVCEEE